MDMRLPDVVFHWRDSADTGAVGWVVLDRVINQVAGGGIFMKDDATLQEVADVARNMSSKFTTTAPQIGGAKGGIRFDPGDPRAEGVLRRFLVECAPLLRNTWVTGADLNTREETVQAVIREEPSIGLPTSQWALAMRIGRAQDGDEALARRRAAQLARLTETDATEFFPLVDAAVGYGVAEAVGFVTRGLATPPRVVIVGAGAVGSSLAWYLTERGLGRVVAIADHEGWVSRAEGLPVRELLALRREIVPRGSNREAERALTRHVPDDNGLGVGVTRRDMRRGQEGLLELLRSCRAEVFSACAGRYQVTHEVLDALDGHTWGRRDERFVVCGANNAFGVFADGALSEDRAGAVLLRLRQLGARGVPDWVANSGTAQFFHLALGRDCDLGSPEAARGEVGRLLSDVGARISSYLEGAQAHAPDVDLFCACERWAERKLARPELLPHAGLA